jgi:hypothetical protein
MSGSTKKKNKIKNKNEITFGGSIGLKCNLLSPEQRLMARILSASEICVFY